MSVDEKGGLCLTLDTVCIRVREDHENRERTTMKTRIGPELETIVKRGYIGRLPMVITGELVFDIISSICRVTNELSIDCKVFNVEYMSPADIKGTPRSLNGRTVTELPQYLPQDGKGILVLNGINLTGGLFRRLCCSFIKNQGVGSYNMPAGWYVIGVVDTDADPLKLTPNGAHSVIFVGHWNEEKETRS